MAVTVTRYYDGTYTDTHEGGSFPLGSNTQGFWLLPYVRTVNGSTFYRFNQIDAYGFAASSFSSNITGQSRVYKGDNLYHLDQDFSDLRRFKTDRVRGSVSAIITDVATGSRIISVKANNGTVTSPAVGPSSTVVLVTRPVGNVDAASNIVSVTAGEGVANTGTLLARGKTAGTWLNWTWNKDVLTGGLTPGVSTNKSIVLSLLAGQGDDTLNANFEIADNPADTWRPGKGNGTVVVHILNDALNETANSNTTDLVWGTFKAPYLTGLTAVSGGQTAAWFNNTPDAAYLLNVNGATFNAIPKAPYRVYKWRLERPGGTDEEIYGQNSVAFSSFASGNIVHLYLTTASAFPRIRYDGFDGAQPANSDVSDAAALVYPPGKVWSSASALAFTLQLSPKAWEGATLGLTKSVVVNDGEPQQISASAKSYTFTSSSTPYSITSVKFKQVQSATNGVLTVNVVKDTNTADVALAIAATQQGVQLGAALTTSGTVGYYMGEGNLAVGVTPTYSNGAVPSNYAVTLSVAAATEADSVNGLNATINAIADARTITVTVTRIVTLAALSGVAINVTRDVSNGTSVTTSDNSTLQSPQGALAVTFTAGQASSVPIHITCDAGTGYSLRRVLVVDAADETYVFATAGAKTELDIALTVPFAKDGASIRVILVVMANLVPTPIVNPQNVYDQGKFLATVTGAYGEFRTGDSVTVEVTPVSLSEAYMTGLLVGRIGFNGADVAAVRDGSKLTVTVPLAVAANVFTVAMYAALATEFLPGSVSPAPSISVTWKISDSMKVSAVTYHRLGVGFTVTAVKVAGSSTCVSATSAVRSLATGFPYVADSVLPFDTVAATPSNGSALFTLKGAQKVSLNYAAGVAQPYLALAVFNYQTGDYIRQGMRPTLTVAPTSGVVLEPANLVEDWKPTETPPDDGYMDDGAVFAVRRVQTEPVLPAVTVSASPVAGRLEVWEGEDWLPRDTRRVTLVARDTFARWAVGTPPSGMVAVTIAAPQLEDTSAMPAAVKVYVAAAADSIDKTVFAPSIVQVSKGGAVGLSAVTPPGFVFIHWIVAEKVVRGISVSIIATADVTATPVFAVATSAAIVPMILNGSGTEYDEGVWVSKQFRAQWPWRPLVATVVKENYRSGTQLAIGLGLDIDLPTGMFEDSPTTSRISITDGAMRRLPPAAVQKSRFVRYGVKTTGADSVLSVAVSTGAGTLKGGH